MNWEIPAAAATGIVATAASIALFGQPPISLRRLPPRPGRGTCQEHDGRSAIVVPMRADDNNIFLVDVGIEDEEGKVQWIKVAVDTGSESLMVASRTCEGCEEGRHLGTIKNDGTVLRRSTVRYGSQQDTVAWRNKRIRLPAWSQTCDPWDTDGALTDAVQCVVGDIPVGVVQKRTGTSDYNILGLGSQSTSGPPAVMASLFPRANVRAFQIDVHSAKEARLILHKPEDKCRPPSFKFDVLPKHLGHGHHYLIDIKKLMLYREGPIGGDNTGRILDDKGYSILLDTGANAMSLPPRLYDQVFSAPFSKGKLSVTLRAQSGQSVELDFDYDRNNNQNAQVLKGSSNELLIVGVTFLIGHSIGYEDHGSFRVLTLDFL